MRSVMVAAAVMAVKEAQAVRRVKGKTASCSGLGLGASTIEGEKEKGLTIVHHY